ncbi:hypothetical protein GH714_040615 [Hevea brasiliensis]|uniref:Cytochrome P450 n=1 Tax=Hevea brasiliensis TaxID=3981 RepID=A0A6A6KWA1_HEVBR|nr:hypothetical protein GH714_040615 [Hevea brasiliensis]
MVVREMDLLDHQVTLLHPLCLSILCFVFFAYFFIKWLTSPPAATHKSLPPSPPKLPLFGNLHRVGLYPHRSLVPLAQRYGPLMLLHFGSKPVIIVSSVEAAREVMKTHDLVFSSRPKLRITEKLLYDRKDVAAAPYGEYWRKMKSICVLQLLSNKRVQSFRSVREEEVAILIKKIEQSCSSSLPVNLSEMFSSLANDVICRVAFGKKYRGEDGKKFRKLMEDVMRLLGGFSVGEFIPWLAWVNWVNGFDAKANRTAKELDKVIDAIIEDHMMNRDTKEDSNKDFVDILLEIQKENTDSLDTESIKALVLDMFIGGSDTSSTVLEWAMTELIRHPRVMKELQNEVKRIGDGKTEITEDDLQEMYYLKLVIKETLRLHTPFPLLAPRESTQDVKIMGYDIAAGTMLLINAWGLARDPKYWSKPEEFWPERFLNNSVDFRGHHLEFIPFGAGRRSCPGIPFAMPIIETMLANLVKKFEWTLPGEAELENLDIAESIGITARRNNPLFAIATPIPH